MSKRGENIYKRRDSRWEGRYIKCYDVQGRAQYGYVYGRTYNEVRDKLSAAKTKGRPIKGVDAENFSGYCDEWLLLCRSRVKEATYVKYYGIVNTRIKPELGERMPEEFSTVLVERFSHSLLTRYGLSSKTVRDILSVLHSILEYGRKREGSGFAQIDIIYPQSKKKEMRVLSEAEQTRLVKYLLTDMDNTKFGILLALFTGMRIGEICALRWEDISFAENVVHVGQTLQRLKILDEPESDYKTRIVIGDTKSDHSNRYIPLNGYLADICRFMYKGIPDAYVLTGKVNQHMDPRTLQYRFGGMIRECNLEGVHFHSLRHTFATRCVESGFEIKSLSEVLGHASTKVTLDRYVHSSMDLKRANMDKVPAYGINSAE